MPRASRGCAACRQRRIGCDGMLPSCRQCLITNRTCSGPLQGAIIINQTQAVASRCRQASVPRPGHHVRIARQPDTSSISALVFVSEFVSFITARNAQLRNKSWLSEIQRGSVRDSGLALDLSMQATALAYCGMVSKNPAAVRQACNLYGTVLPQHSRAISGHAGPPQAAAISTSVILSFFEAMCSTNSKAYATHLNAARKMLHLAQKDPDEHGVLSELAKHVQCQSLFIMVTSPSDYVAIAPAKTPIVRTCGSQSAEMGQIVDRLIAHLFDLGELLVHKVCRCGNPLHIACELEIGMEFDALWDEYQKEATQSGKPIEWYCEGETIYRDAFTAMTVAYFSASAILLNNLHLQTAGYERGTINDACETILRCSAFLTDKHIGCAYLRMFFPLTLVAMHSPGNEQRTIATGYLGGWLQDTAFAGLSSIAIQRIKSINTQLTTRGLA